MKNLYLEVLMLNTVDVREWLGSNLSILISHPVNQLMVWGKLNLS